MPEIELYNIKYTLSVQERRTFVLTIKSATINFGALVNPMDRKVCSYGGFRLLSDDPAIFDSNNLACDVLTKLNEILEVDNYDNSDSMTDYFDVGYYTSIYIGNRDSDKPAFVYDPSGKALKEAKVIGDAMGRKGMRTQSKQVGSKRL